jgi:hypothetical protein
MLWLITLQSECRPLNLYRGNKQKGENMSDQKKPFEGGVTSDLVMREIKNEEWREYDFDDRVYRIEEPISVHFHSGGTKIGRAHV